ncbi:Holliday junction branch migration protein RuvA [Butyrivibrio sp. NC2002]|uniref:Holliday junction branch migration protein RuvA n=1 Tax=Butyrivibrio sp. NC2002 TaxID=1410610 RepID=UPI00055A0CAA|nr:Holliday junction branch migration protein RuvA [Butyrivibrio sp. NC2002]
MIAFVNGILDMTDGQSCVIDVQGVGYNVNISGYTADRLPGIGEIVKLYTYLSVREDAMSLYGFLSRDELDFFKMLISVSGIGPKVGQAILSVMTPDDLRFAILAGDSKSISKAPGVGKKTAERLVLELHDKISAEDITGADFGGDGLSGSSEKEGAQSEALEALVALGYSASEASKAVRKVLSSKEVSLDDTEAILKMALKELF